MHLSELDQSHRNTILAALRFYQTYLETGNAPTGDRLQMIYEIAGDGGTLASTADIDELCEMINADET